MSIQDERIRQELTQEALARLAHVTRPVIGRMESGSPVQEKSFLNVCQALNIPREQVEGVKIYVPVRDRRRRKAKKQ